jgi:CheY-like chemotaxis protein
VAVPAPEALDPLDPLRVLYVDDDPRLRRLMRNMISGVGHHVEVASDGAAALKLFRQSLATGPPFQVVITDLGMPNMDGRQVARGVKELSPETPVLVLTGWGTRLSAEGDIPPQVDEVLSKPPSLRQISQALARFQAVKPGTLVMADARD